jgi:transketolase
MLKIPGVDISTGSLGHGLSIALGMALAARLNKKEYMTYVLMGDGELGEGSVWEAAMAASHFKVDNLLAIIDKNNLQVDGFTADILNIEPLAEKWQAFGWGVREIDGHNIGDILDAVESVPFESRKPSVIIANTTKGKGLTFAENKINFHYHDVDDEIVENAQIIFDNYEEGGEER